MSDSSASVGSIRTRITNMPITVTMLCRSGGIATVMAPIPDAWLLISNIIWPVFVRSWKASDSRCTWRNRSLRRSSTMLWSSFVFT